jgi:hypothetical protein
MQQFRAALSQYVLQAGPSLLEACLSRRPWAVNVCEERRRERASNSWGTDGEGGGGGARKPNMKMCVRRRVLSCREGEIGPNERHKMRQLADKAHIALSGWVFQETPSPGGGSL